MSQLSYKDLSAFFEKLRYLSSEAKGLETALNSNFPEMKQFFQSLAKKLDNFRELGGQLNIFEICNLGRDELRNCAVLAWLLDENGSHGLGREFLEGILEQSDGASIISREALAQGYAVRTEFCPAADNANRVDIVCDGNAFLLYIEVKIDSFEHAHQTNRYFEKLVNTDRDREKALIFISPGILPECENSYFIRWQDCANVLDRMSVEKLQKNSVLLAAILQQYSDFIRNFQN